MPVFDFAGRKRPHHHGEEVHAFHEHPEEVGAVKVVDNSHLHLANPLQQRAQVTKSSIATSVNKQPLAGTNYSSNSPLGLLCLPA